ncbi:MAG TPA: hypothetical protein VNA20_15275 [Frankiaceae bacterium]|nr:hypothetical protein [Frankiaceae bacterium]
MNVRSKIGFSALAVGAFCTLLATPASAAGYNLTKVSSPGGTVNGVCAFVADLPDQSFNNMTIAVKYEIFAEDPAYAVSGICQIKDVNNRVYGTIVAGAPGMYATNADDVVVPRNIVGAKACNTPEALWLDGTEANPTNKTTCTAL